MVRIVSDRDSPFFTLECCYNIYHLHGSGEAHAYSDPGQVVLTSFTAMTFPPSLSIAAWKLQLVRVEGS